MKTEMDCPTMTSRARLSFSGLSPWLLLAAALLTLRPTAALALGFRIPNQDAASTARGNAFTATADNPSALYYNPAGITQLSGQNLQFGLHVISVNSTYNGPGGLSAESESEIQPVPQLYYTRSIPDSRWSYGLGIYAPFGLSIEWPDDVSFSKTALEGDLMTVAVNPVVAYKLTDTLSIAAGPSIDYSRVKLRQGIPAPVPGEVLFRGDGFSASFTAGLLWQPHPKWSFGASYRYSSCIEHEGHMETQNTIPDLSGRVSTSAELQFPQYVRGGVSFRPTTNWNFEVDLDWTDWDNLNSVTFEGSSKLFGTDSVFPLHWESSWLAHIGATRYLKHGWWVSAGYFFSQNSTSEKYFNPVVPDTDLHVGSLGFGRKGRKWSWALSGQIITGPDREVNSSIFTQANGKYHWFNQAVNASIAYHF
jgi:long-chain fatty acid transport protein